MKTNCNYNQICSSLLKILPERQRDVISGRFGLNSSMKRETLEVIGERYGITRERVRQIEKDSFLKLKPELKKYSAVFNYFESYLKGVGGLQKEDVLLVSLAGEKNVNYAYFLLTIGEGFTRIGDTEDFYPLWALGEKAVEIAKKSIAVACKSIEKAKKPILFKNIPFSYLEASKKVGKTQEGLWGLKSWPEITPKGIKDKAYLALKKESTPLHFTQVAKLLDSALPQTVHNELIKDARFVLVGRGLYGLKEWGYESGCVKDIISKALREAKKPLSREQIVRNVLKQRFVKENTVLLNLSNKDYFSKVSEGFYTLNHKEA